MQTNRARLVKGSRFSGVVTAVGILFAALPLLTCAADTPAILDQQQILSQTVRDNGSGSLAATETLGFRDRQWTSRTTCMTLEGNPDHLYEAKLQMFGDPYSKINNQQTLLVMKHFVQGTNAEWTDGPNIILQVMHDATQSANGSVWTVMHGGLSYTVTNSLKGDDQVVIEVSIYKQKPLKSVA